MAKAILFSALVALVAFNEVQSRSPIPPGWYSESSEERGNPFKEPWEISFEKYLAKYETAYPWPQRNPFVNRQHSQKEERDRPRLDANSAAESPNKYIPSGNGWIDPGVFLQISRPGPVNYLETPKKNYNRRPGLNSPLPRRPQGNQSPPVVNPPPEGDQLSHEVHTPPQTLQNYGPKPGDNSASQNLGNDDVKVNPSQGDEQ